MRLRSQFFIFFFLLVGASSASETPYPPWDGHESIADYGKRVNLPLTKILDLGNDVKMELVLIPAGKFMMGSPKPKPPHPFPSRIDESAFHKSILVGQVLTGISGGLLLVFLVIVAIESIRRKRRPQFSLARLLAMVIATGGCVISGLHWQQSVESLRKVQVKYREAYEEAEKYEYWLRNAEGAYACVPDPSENPEHWVTLTKAFYMGKFPVTQEQYEKVVGTNPSECKGKNNPVTNVPWHIAKEFCDKLTAQVRQVVRLPSEAEWEYACRVGGTESYGGSAYHGFEHPVGQHRPNGFGLYDMHDDDLWQWCQDWWEESYYSYSPAVNPVGPSDGKYHTMRGGEFGFLHCSHTFTYRGRDSLLSSGGDNGIRIVVSATTATNNDPNPPGHQELIAKAGQFYDKMTDPDFEGRDLFVQAVAREVCPEAKDIFAWMDEKTKGIKDEWVRLRGERIAKREIGRMALLVKLDGHSDLVARLEIALKEASQKPKPDAKMFIESVEQRIKDAKK